MHLATAKGLSERRARRFHKLLMHFFRRFPLHRVTVATLVAGLLFAANTASAQPIHLELDAARSRIEFTLGATFHTVHGTFRLTRGSIDFDPATGAASGALVADATSAETGNTGRDQKMRREILESTKYPTVLFTPQHVRGALPGIGGNSQIELAGVFTLHGQSHNMTLSVPVRMGRGEVDAEVSFVVPYVRWGLKNPSTFVLRVSDEVKVSVYAVGEITSASTR
jgi:polyisoprenoid-binding protein YceI